MLIKFKTSRKSSLITASSLLTSTSQSKVHFGGLQGPPLRLHFRIIIVDSFNTMSKYEPKQAHHKPRERKRKKIIYRSLSDFAVKNICIFQNLQPDGMSC